MNAYDVLLHSLAILHRDEPATVDELIKLCNAWYRLEGNEVGGSLHLVLDDDNIEDEHVAFCIGWAIEHDDAAGAALGMVLRCISEEDRRAVVERINRP
jgi:hypothetical protein